MLRISRPDTCEHSTGVHYYQTGLDRRGVHTCIARNGGAAARGRKFRPAVATSRARRSRLPFRHAKSRPRWASSVRDDEKRNRPRHGEHAHRHPSRTHNRQIDLGRVQGSPNAGSENPALLASHQHASGVRTRDQKKESRHPSECGLRLISCAPVAGVLLWHRVLWAGRCRRCSVLPDHRVEL